MILTEQQEQLLMMLPETEYGAALFDWIRQELKALEKKEEYGGKISNNPLIEDFRTQLGMKIAFRRILRKPQELKEKRHLKGVSQ